MKPYRKEAIESSLIFFWQIQRGTQGISKNSEAIFERFFEEICKRILNSIIKTDVRMSGIHRWFSEISETILKHGMFS